MKKVGRSLPLEAGNLDLVEKSKLPENIPHAKFNIAIAGYTVNDEALFDVTLHVDFHS